MEETSPNHQAKLIQSDPNDACEKQKKLRDLERRRTQRKAVKAAMPIPKEGLLLLLVMKKEPLAETHKLARLFDCLNAAYLP